VSAYVIDHSFGAAVGHAVEPVFEPLGFDWRINIGVLASLSAREVFVATLGQVAAAETPDAPGTALRTMRVVNVPVGHVHGFSFKRGTQGFVLTVAAEMMDEVLTPAEGLRRVLAHATVVQGTVSMRSTMEQIFAEFAGRSFARAHLLRALAAALIGLVAREIADTAGTPEETASTDLLRRFEALLEQHLLAHWTVSDYAAALSITPTHLSRVVRAATGNAASRLILERIIREARRNLVYTNLPVATIAFALGFNDPAYFSRLFAGATGLSPRRFRDKVHAGG
jgi:AraC family transcriptional activator of pobA